MAVRNPERPRIGRSFEIIGRIGPSKALRPTPPGSLPIYSTASRWSTGNIATRRLLGGQSRGFRQLRAASLGGAASLCRRGVRGGLTARPGGHASRADGRRNLATRRTIAPVTATGFANAVATGATSTSSLAAATNTSLGKSRRISNGRAKCEAGGGSQYDHREQSSKSLQHDFSL